MTRDLEQTYLAQVKLPFDRRTNVIPYLEYLNVMVGMLDQTPTIREWQAGGATFIGTGANIVATVAPVPAGFQDTYTLLTVQIDNNSILLDCRIAITGNVLVPDLSFARLSSDANTQRNLLSNLQAGDAGRFGPVRDLVLGPGQAIELHSLAVVAVGDVVNVRFLRWREPGQVANSPENSNEDITIA